MKTHIQQEVCPFCENTTDIGIIGTDRATICLCSKCHRCWEIIDSKVHRLTRYKKEPETTNEFALCPVCWSEMLPDYDRWVVKCPSPICGFEKRLPGLSPKQEKLKKEYKKVRKEVFSLMSEGKQVPNDLQLTLKKLRSSYNGFVESDEEPLR